MDTEVVHPFKVTLYCIVLLPALIKLTSPLFKSTVAIEELLELHTPPVVLFVRLIVLPTHPPVGPAIDATSGGNFTFTFVV